jgi:hypothetical protein
MRACWVIIYYSGMEITGFNSTHTYIPEDLADMAMKIVKDASFLKNLLQVHSSHDVIK